MSGGLPYALGALTTDAFAELIAGAGPVVVLLPVGAVEPHGPHLGLATDVAISEGACYEAASPLEELGFVPLVAPSIPFGVTECASAFSGAISVPEDVVTSYLRAACRALLSQGVRRVCVVNSHLEPAHDRAVRAATEDLEGKACVASPLDRRWARTLSEEFRRGACHAGRYETSIALACAPELVKDEIRRDLPEVDISLSENLAEGVTDFEKMGLSRAYAGAPAEATAAEGAELLRRLRTMIVTEIRESLDAPS